MEPERAFSLVTSAYYRGVPADVVGTALQHFVRVMEDAGGPVDARLANLLYVFCRIAQSSPEARREIRAKQTTLTGRAAEFVAKILAAANDPAFPNALTQRIFGPESLDRLWAEFFVTGDPEPVLTIVRTLDAPNGIRRLLSAWLQTRSWFGGGKRAEQVETLRNVGLVMDLKTRSIVTEGDLDCVCFALAEQKVPIFKLLPCPLPQDDLLNLCVKGSALWSLRLNSHDHPVVRAVCEAERARPGGPGRAKLVEPIATPKPFML